MLPASYRQIQNLQQLCVRFTFLSHKALHTAVVIAHPGREASLPRLSPVPPAPVSPWPALFAPAVARPAIAAEVGRYRVRMAQSVEDRDAACRLRFKVFNIELGEGLASSYLTGLDADDFDLFCEHLLVEDRLTHRVVGTYRMQAGVTAARNLGYYSEQEFDFAPYEHLRPAILELGRASIDREHRTPEVLMLLWRGIAQYASCMGLRYLIGCSSLNSTDPQEGWQMYRRLARYLVTPDLATVPTAAFACPDEQTGGCPQPSPLDESDYENSAPIPRLLRTYLTIGARICAPPAWDRAFGTIDFLTLLDLDALAPAARNRFLAPLTS